MTIKLLNQKYFEKREKVMNRRKLARLNALKSGATKNRLLGNNPGEKLEATPNALRGALGRAETGMVAGRVALPHGTVKRLPTGLYEALASNGAKVHLPGFLGAKNSGHLGRAGSIIKLGNKRKFVTKKAKRFTGDSKLETKVSKYKEPRMDRGYWSRVKRLIDERE